VPPPAPPARAFDPERLREEFPILARTVHGKPLVYLDNAATSQRPNAVVEAVSRFSRESNANVHRGVHRLSQEATDAYEAARETARAFLGAAEAREVVFCRGTTEAVNLVAQTFGRQNVRAGDEVLVSTMEHHSNIVPWQMLCEEKGARLVVAPIDDRGELLLEEFGRLLTPRTRLAAITHVSNSLGTVVPVKEVVRAAHARGVPVLLDGAQAVPHLRVDVSEIGCDFYAFSGHKVYGPTGIGVLYARAALLERMPPWQGGGDMIRHVTFEKTTYADPPQKFEAGTPNVAGAVGLAAAIRWVEGVGLEEIGRHERALLDRATEAVLAVPGVRVLGTAREKAAVLSFVMDGVHPHDVGTILDVEGVAIRTGHHCAHPVMERFGVPATARASFAAFNGSSDVDALVRGLRRVREMFPLGPGP
jgi:cysteine desulfurase/selenocysteine lyase